jgi:hypothetical protein
MSERYRGKVPERAMGVAAGPSVEEMKGEDEPTRQTKDAHGGDGRRPLDDMTDGTDA